MNTIRSRVRWLAAPFALALLLPASLVGCRAEQQMPEQEAGMPPEVAEEFRRRMQEAGWDTTGPQPGAPAATPAPEAEQPPDPE